ncbi:MAG TPA: hypothetical protein VK864_04220 [Longimicrobiales bacterium]|jgi:hypothetical protein|nr:hypothetical protein [Longimicrobiales bacterium]
MATIVLRALGALIVTVYAASPTAAQQPQSAVLNNLEVQQLIKRAEPGDHARLGAHFAALAERYTAEAKRHTAMAQAFVASPVRRTAASSAADHCKRLTELNTQSAATLRELATHHEKLAGGAPSTAPHDSARFEAGAGAPAPSEKELAALAAKASTPADHRALEEYFLTAAKRYTAQANEHVTMAQAYRGTRIASAAAHCDRLVTLSRDSAKEANAAAAMHKDLAGVTR